MPKPRLPTRWIVREIAVNWIGYKFGLRSLTKRSVINNVNWDPQQDVEEKGGHRLAYIKKMLQMTLGEDGFAHYWPPRRVLEIGPGGTALLALYLLSEGVKEYIGVDRYPSDIWSEHPAKCYEIALAKLNNRKHLESALSTSKRGQGPIRYYGSESTGAFARIEPGSVDLIFSWGALEHVGEPFQILAGSKPLLSADGIALHTIDTGPHTWWQFENPYVFLSVPDWLWGLMYWRRGHINRFMPADYLRWAKDAGYTVKELDRIMGPYQWPHNAARGRSGMTHTVEGKEHLWIRPHLLERYRQASDEDILTRYLMLALIS